MTDWVNVHKFLATVLYVLFITVLIGGSLWVSKDVNDIGEVL